MTNGRGGGRGVMIMIALVIDGMLGFLVAVFPCCTFYLCLWVGFGRGCDLFGGCRGFSQGMADFIVCRYLIAMVEWQYI